MNNSGIKNNFIIKLVLVFCIAFGAGMLLGSLIKSGSISPELNFGLSRSYNILVMGVDSTDREENSRSDTMILVSIGKKNQEIVMVWIPRDTRVEIGQERYDKINSINALKGPEAAAIEVGKLLSLKVDYYVTTNFSGFAKIIDILGGVHIDVPSAMQHYDPDPDLNINLAQGPQVLNGHDALRFVRYREKYTADIGRTGRQQQFIKALAAELFSTKAVIKLPQLLPEIIKNVHTNIPMKDMLFLAEAARDFNLEGIITQTLPGYPFTDPRNGASYWVADEDIARGIVKDLLKGKKFEVAIDPPRHAVPVMQNNIVPEADPNDAAQEAGDLAGDADNLDDINLDDAAVDEAVPGEDQQDEAEQSDAGIGEQPGEADAPEETQEVGETVDTTNPDGLLQDLAEDAAPVTVPR